MEYFFNLKICKILCRSLNNEAPPSTIMASTKKLGKKKSKTSSNKLYRVRVIEEDGDLVKVHFIGYSSREDEWKTREELVLLQGGATPDSDDARDSSATETSQPCCDVWQPFSLYRELGNKIKCSLQSARKESPTVKINISFDKLLLDGGLGRIGIKKRKHYGQQRYTIKSYKDLDPLLGSNWHWRGLNEAGDFCYVMLPTLEFWLKHKKPLKEFLPPTHEVRSSTRDLGFSLMFTFVRGDGISSQFGTNTDIFS